jgi:methionine synthase II (cobalamin-independent)
MQAIKDLLACRADLEKAKVEKARLETLERQLKDKVLEYFAENGLDKVTIDGQTLYTTTKVWARLDGDVETVAPALQFYGLGYLIKPTVNTNSLSSWYREQLDTGQEIPQGLQAILKVSDSPDISVRGKSGA